MPVTAAVVGIGAAAGTAAGGAISAHETGKAAENAATTTSTAATKAAQIQADAANNAAQLQAQSAADALNYTKQQSALSLQQYNAQQARLQPYRNLGNFAMGLPNDPAPAPLQLPTIPGTSGGTPSASGGSSGSQDPVQSYMLGLLNAGVSPQSVAQQTNAKFGPSIGTGALYYPNNNTIGLPNFYVAGPQQGQTGGWNVVQRSGGSTAAPAAATSSTSSLTPLSQATMAGAPTLINPTPLPGAATQPTSYRTLSQLGGF